MSDPAAEQLEPDASQERAIELICALKGPRLVVITGGPGTGKTTCLKRALEVLGPTCKVELAAPTGKAAKRMRQATGQDARTIHRMLGFHPVRGFAFNAEAPIPAEVVVVDEASMLDIELAAALFCAIGPHTRLVLVGDVDQLPPVGPGAPFADLIKSGMVPVARLTRLHRSAQDSWVHRNAQRVLRGEMIDDLAIKNDFRLVHVDVAANVLRAVRTEVERLRAEQEQCQVLIPQSTGAAGTDAANRMLQDVFNPPPAVARDEHYLQRDKYTMRIGDRVIQTKNDYQLGVFNGDVGDILAIDKDGAEVAILDGPIVRYRLDQTKAMHLAYALSVHRSQGSEFPWVVCVVHSTHTHMLTRQLFYTAITRARKGVVLVGDDRGLKTAISTGRVPVRNTTLVERMRNDLDEITVEG